MEMIGSVLIVLIGLSFYAFVMWRSDGYPRFWESKQITDNKNSRNGKK